MGGQVLEVLRQGGVVLLKTVGKYCYSGGFRLKWGVKCIYCGVFRVKEMVESGCDDEGVSWRVRWHKTTWYGGLCGGGWFWEGWVNSWWCLTRVNARIN